MDRILGSRGTGKTKQLMYLEYLLVLTPKQ